MTMGIDAVRLNVPTVRDTDRPSHAQKATSADPGSGVEKVSGPSASPSSTGVGARQCRTCAERKYQDVSNDPSVSMQAPTSLATGQEASAVRAHEQEHVTSNAARAERDGMVARSTVIIHTGICPECGRVYVSGGTTTTTYTRKVSAAIADDARGLLFDATA